MEKPKICECCGWPEPAKYKYILDDMDVSALLKIWQAVIEQGTYEINVKEIGLIQGERMKVTQLRFHGLLAKARNKKGAHIPNTWIFTHRAKQFLHGEIAIPGYVITQANKVIGHAPQGDSVHRNDYKILADFRATYEVVSEPGQIQQEKLI